MRYLVLKIRLDTLALLYAIASCLASRPAEEKGNGIITQKKVIRTPVEIPLQTVKNSGPSERKAVQD